MSIKVPYARADAEEGTKNTEISDAQRLDAVMDILKDACAKIDEGGKRMDARMAQMDARMDSIENLRKDAAEDEKEEAKADADEDTKEEAKADAKDDMPEELAADRKDAAKDEDEEEEMADADDEMMADHAPITRAEAAALRADLASMSRRMPAMLTDADRLRFANIQESADPVFQAFGDRAPAPLDGETPVQYKRRLAGKMQPHSDKWKDVRLSAIADEASLDVIVQDVYADSLQAAKRGAQVPQGQLRERVTQRGGHTIVEWDGEPQAWMDSFAGNSMRGTGNFLRPN